MCVCCIDASLVVCQYIAATHAPAHVCVCIHIWLVSSEDMATRASIACCCFVIILMTQTAAQLHANMIMSLLCFILTPSNHLNMSSCDLPFVYSICNAKACT